MNLILKMIRQVSITLSLLICLLCNSYFVSVAEDIGKIFIFDPPNHHSLKKTEQLNIKKDSFEFNKTDENTVQR